MPVTPTLLRKLLRRPEIVAAIRQEDPYDDLFVEEVTFFGGPNQVIQGLTNRSAHTLRLLLSTIFGDGSNLPQEYAQQVRRAAGVVLRVSDEICRRAGLERGIAPTTGPREEIALPSRERLYYLMNTVSFNDALVRRAEDAGLAGWFVAPGEHRLRLQGGTDDGLILTPLLRVPGGLLVINPGELAARLRHHLIVTALEFGCREALASAFRETVLGQVQELLLLCDARPAGPPTIEANGLVLRQQFSGTSSMIIDVAVCTDDLSDYDAGDPYGTWAANPGGLIQSVIDPPGEPQPADCRTLRLGVTDGFARSTFIGFEANRRPGPMLSVPFDELRVMVELDGGDPLFLWYFARADDRFHEEVRVFSWAVLDTYAIYREHESSFYLGDGPRATFVTVAAGEGLPLRVEAQRRTDRHHVAAPNSQGYVELVSLYGRDTGPVYFVHPRHGLHFDVVELGDLRFWIRGATADEPSVRELLNDLLESIAFWTWQLGTALYDDIAGRNGDRRDVVITVSVDDEQDWLAELSGETGAARDETTSWVAASWVDSAEITLTLRHGGVLALFDESNEPDRQLVSALCEVLLGLAAGSAQAAECVDLLAPRGPKKMIHILRSSDVRLRPTRIRPRMVRSAVTSELLDELGQQLAPNGVDHEQQIEPGQRTNVLNEAVAFYFAELEARFAELSSPGLLQFLVANDEALLADAARRAWLLPSRLACFGPDSLKGGEFLDQEQDQIAASIASRFLIEYAVAVPPQGDSPIDLLAYDRLLAIASELISRAKLSDAVRYGFSDVQLSLLRSGRLGVSRGDSYTAGSRAVVEAATEARRVAALAGTPEEDAPATTAPPSRDPLALLQAIDDAMTDEFGLSLTDLYNGLYALANLGDRIGGEVVLVDAEAVDAHLRDELGWGDAMRRTFRTELTLSPREDFLAIGNDAWPWRYNRNASYMRRPLLLLELSEGQTQLCWGQRRLRECARYWHNLLLNGRMRASGAALKVLMSTIRQDENKQFENDTAVALAGCGFPYTDSGVKKISGERLAGDNGEDLGDIDAIAYNPAKNILIVAEAKDLEMALTPFELSNEVEALMTGKRNAVSRVSVRSSWVRANVDLALKHLKAPSPPHAPTVQPVVVTSRTLIASKVVSASVPIVAIEELPTWVAGLRPPPRQDPASASRRKPRRRR